jgi:hypothetical protein
MNEIIINSIIMAAIQLFDAAMEYSGGKPVPDLEQLKAKLDEFATHRAKMEEYDVGFVEDIKAKVRGFLDAKVMPMVHK